VYRDDRAFGFHVSRQEQAEWLEQAYQIHDENDYIFSLGWFNLLDDPESVDRGLTTGLMTHEGERKASFDAYREARVKSR
jgi:hypothetical protein